MRMPIKTQQFQDLEKLPEMQALAVVHHIQAMGEVVFRMAV